MWNQLGKRLVRGENIGQAFQFVNSGNAELGLVAWSQLKRNDAAIEGSYWLLPARYYSPIEQQAILSAGHGGGAHVHVIYKGAMSRLESFAPMDTIYPDAE